MDDAAYGVALGYAIGDLRDQVAEERALRENAEANVSVLRAKVHALEVYLCALKASLAE